MEGAIMDRIIATLFPDYPLRSKLNFGRVGDIPLFSILVEIISSLSEEQGSWT